MLTLGPEEPGQADGWEGGRGSRRAGGRELCTGEPATGRGRGRPGSYGCGQTWFSTRPKLPANQDFPSGPMVKNPPSKAGEAGLTPGWGSKVPHAAGQLSLHASTETRHSSPIPPPKKLPANHVWLSL